MKRHTFTIGAALAVFALSQAPVFGQAGSRPNTTGSSSGSAAPRGGGSSSSGSSTSSAGSSTSSSGSSGTAVSRPSSGGFGSGVAVARERAPQRPMAMPRGAAGMGSGETAARPGSEARMSRGNPSSHAVPAYSRPRDGRASMGAAVNRADAPPPPFAGAIINQYYNPYLYNSWRFGYAPFGYGLGYGLGYGYGYYDPYYGPGAYGYGGGYGAPSYSAGGYSSQHRGTGNLRLRVRPSDAQVYVDGYYVGTVSEFDGLFQRLNIDAGAHRLELRAEGYETTEFEVFVTPGETITYRGDMKRVNP